jgi:broad specificity phosphatase PhoE
MAWPFAPSLATAVHASVSMIGSYPPSTAAVRLFSVPDCKEAIRAPSSKILHLVRHAEGTHNLCEIESKKPIHLDARLTQRGIDQCLELSSFTKKLQVEAVLVSPMTRCLQTARLAFPHIYGPVKTNNKYMVFDCGNELGACGANVPFIAYEEWRETVNFLCDSRRPLHILQNEYPHVNFQFISDDRDPLWSHYEKIFGSHDSHINRRESDDPTGLYNRAHSAWRVLLDRPEKEIALVGHSAFFMHMFTPLFDELDGVVRYEDKLVRDLMTAAKFDNCELRTVVVDYP